MARTVRDVMKRMAEAFVPERAQGVDASVQFEIAGEEAGEWVVTIREGQCTVEEGRAAHPTLTFSADSQDFLAVINGELEGMKAFMTGKLRLVGDLSLAMKLLSFFELKGERD